MAKYTLIDVMRGIRKHGLGDKLSDGCYKFLIGIILEANELGFKNPIDLTVNQALAIGGGDSRQTLYNRRKALKKIMLNGKHLVTIKVGNYGSRSLAKYQIDYDLLCSYKDVWQGGMDIPSNEIDGSLTDPLTVERRWLDTTLDGSLPILRSEEKREQQTSNARANPIPDLDPEIKQQSTIDDNYGIITEHTADDWIEYLTHIMKKPEQKYAPIAVQELAQWLVSNNDLELIEQCYDEFSKVPLKKVFNRQGFFLKIISDVGGNTNFRQ